MKKNEVGLKKINKQIFYDASIHQYNKSLDKTVKGLDYKLIDKIKKYIHCARAETKKLKISKKVQEEIGAIGSRIGMDVTETGKIISMEGNKYTHFKIDYYSNKVFVSFLKKSLKFQKMEWLS